jgi:hypothetical protein
MNRADEPAFPTHEVWDDEKTDIGWIGGGLSKRELFAAMMAQGLLSNITVGRDEFMPFVVATSVRYADAILAELDKAASCCLLYTSDAADDM